MLKRFYVAPVAALAFCFLLPIWLNGCATIPYDYPRSISSALYLPEKTDLGKEIGPFVAKHRGASGFYLLPSGVEAFLARVLLIERGGKDPRPAILISLKPTSPASSC